MLRNSMIREMAFKANFLLWMGVELLWFIGQIVFGGGKVFAVKDYFVANQLPPALASAPTDPNDPLFQYIRDRLLDSFDTFGSGNRWLGYSSPHYPNGDEGVSQLLGFTRGRSWL